MYGCHLKARQHATQARQRRKAVGAGVAPRDPESLRLLPLVNVESQRVFFCPTFCGELLRALPALVGETDFQRVTVEFVDSDRGPLPVIYGDRSIVPAGLLARIYG